MEPLDASSNHCVLEATVNYGSLLVRMLMEAGINVSLLHPKQIKYFACMMLSVNKTDQIDAQLIALYGEKMKPKPCMMPTEVIQQLKQQKTLLAQLQK